MVSLHLVLLFEYAVPDNPSHLSPAAPRPYPYVHVVPPVGNVRPVGLLGSFGYVAVNNRLDVQQSGAPVDLDLLGRTSAE